MLSVYQSNRIERLLDTLIGILRDRPLGDPMQPERIVVQGRGMRAWLAMQLAGRLGICANVQFPFPRAAIEEMLERVLAEKHPETKPFRKGYMLWSIMAALGEFRGYPAFTEINSYLADDPHGMKRFQLAGKIADTFDQYLMLRPEMVLEWEQKPKKDWQSLLFKSLFDKHGSAHIAYAWHSFRECFDREHVQRSRLPQRLSLFCLLNLPPIFMDILNKLGREMEINLLLLNPTMQFWSDIRSTGDISRNSRRLAVGENTDQYYETGHPLLASMGGLMQDFQRVLSGEGGQFDYSEGPEDLFCDPLGGDPSEPPRLLNALQSDIFKLKTKTFGDEELPCIAPEDHSISIHACHSRMREVQVLFDLLRAEFEGNPGLEPDEVIVLAPHMEEYAPFVESVFGVEDDEKRVIPFHISDRGIAVEAPLVEAFGMLLSLVRSRMTYQEVFDLLSSEAVHDHFRMTRSEVESVMNRAADCGIRWAIDSDHRADFGQPELKGNTWRFGLERLLMGYAMAPGLNEQYAGVMPYDDIEGQEAQAIGRLAHFSETLFEVRKSLSEPRTLDQWRVDLEGALTRLFSTDENFTYQRQIVRGALDKMQRRGEYAGFKEKLDLHVVHALLGDYFNLQPSPRKIFSGKVSFCNMATVRSIPFKVIALLGINDGEFPRNDSALSFDLTAGEGARPGDLSVRRDDRSLFFESLLSAREKLLITYVGQSIRDNSNLPPSVLVGELLDTIGETFVVYGDQSTSVEKNQEAVRNRLVLKHPLQAFSPDYFIHGGKGLLYSYSARACDEARTLLSESEEAKSFFQGPLETISDIEQANVNLQDILRFFRLPVDFLLKRILGVYLDEEDVAVPDREPMELGGLERYKLGDHLLDISLAGQNMKEYYPRVAAMGVLPLGEAGRLVFSDLVAEIQPISEAVLGRRAEPRLPTLDIAIGLDDMQIVGRLGDNWPEARVVTVCSGLADHRQLKLWIEHLALCASGDPEYPRRSLLFGRGEGGYDTIAFKAVETEDARTFLSDLVAIYQMGLRSPLPFFPQTSRIYFEKISKSGDTADINAHEARKEASRAWLNDYDSKKASVVRVYGDRNPVDEPDFPDLASKIFGPMFRYLEKGEER